MASIVATNEEAAVERLEDSDNLQHVFYTLPFKEVTLVDTCLWQKCWQVCILILLMLKLSSNALMDCPLQSEGISDGPLATDGSNLEIELRRWYHRVPIFVRLHLYHRVRNSEEVACFENHMFDVSFMKGVALLVQCCLRLGSVCTRCCFQVMCIQSESLQLTMALSVKEMIIIQSRKIMWILPVPACHWHKKEGQAQQKKQSQCQAQANMKGQAQAMQGKGYSLIPNSDTILFQSECSWRSLPGMSLGLQELLSLTLVTVVMVLIITGFKKERCTTLILSVLNSIKAFSTQSQRRWVIIWIWKCHALFDSLILISILYSLSFHFYVWVNSHKSLN